MSIFHVRSCNDTWRRAMLNNKKCERYFWRRMFFSTFYYNDIVTYSRWQPVQNPNKIYDQSTEASKKAAVNLWRQKRMTILQVYLRNLCAKSVKLTFKRKLYSNSFLKLVIYAENIDFLAAANQFMFRFFGFVIFPAYEELEKTTVIVN